MGQPSDKTVMPEVEIIVKSGDHEKRLTGRHYVVVVLDGEDVTGVRSPSNNSALRELEQHAKATLKRGD